MSVSQDFRLETGRINDCSYLVSLISRQTAENTVFSYWRQRSALRVCERERERERVGEQGRERERVKKVLVVNRETEGESF